MRPLLLTLLLSTPALAHDWCQDDHGPTGNELIRLLLEPTPSASGLDLEDVKRLVAELEAVVPQNPEYIYPIIVQVDPSDEINAGGGYLWYIGKEEEKYASLTVNQGMLDAPGLTESHLRAILAHEMAHIAIGHSLHDAFEGDADHVLTRQEELEADRVGADYLEALGYDRSDMSKAVLWLGEGAGVKALP